MRRLIGVNWSLDPTLKERDQILIIHGPKQTQKKQILAQGMQYISSCLQTLVSVHRSLFPKKKYMAAPHFSGLSQILTLLPQPKIDP